MAMVMPRSFSSGALSMSSTLRFWMFAFSVDRQLMIAAVSVVLPWSTWPVVPMLTCGLDRSNFAFAMFVLSFYPRRVLRGCQFLALGLRYDLFFNGPRRFFVVCELHRVGRAALCRRAQIGRVPEHL